MENEGLFYAIDESVLKIVKCIVDENPQRVHIKNGYGWRPFDCAIACKKPNIAQYLWEKRGRPNLKNYRDGKWTPVHSAAYDGKTATLKWVTENNILPMRQVLNIKNTRKWTPLDVAIANGNLEMAQFLFEKGGRPNLDAYCDGNTTPVQMAASYDENITILKWVFEKGVLPLRVLNSKNHYGRTSLGYARGKTATLLRRLPVDPVFLAMHRAKRDHKCVLRKLPDELLDMVVEEVAARFHLKVVW